ncbi:hypothetical protein S245_056171, partial [Arachis hypogaea]
DKASLIKGQDPKEVSKDTSTTNPILRSKEEEEALTETFDSRFEDDLDVMFGENWLWLCGNSIGGSFSLP